MSLARRIAWLAAAALLTAAVASLPGCGSSGGGATESTPSGQTAPPPGGGPGGAVARECTPTLRVTGVDCAAAEAVVEEWEATAGCRPSGGKSESGCSVGAYRCLAVEKRERRGVFCARPDRSIVFVPKSG